MIAQWNREKKKIKNRPIYIMRKQNCFETKLFLCLLKNQFLPQFDATHINVSSCAVKFQDRTEKAIFWKEQRSCVKQKYFIVEKASWCSPVVCSMYFDAKYEGGLYVDRKKLRKCQIRAWIEACMSAGQNNVSYSIKQTYESFLAANLNDKLILLNCI